MSSKLDAGHREEIVRGPLRALDGGAAPPVPFRACSRPRLRRHSRPRFTSTVSLRSSTTCCTTSTERRWPIRSRCAFPSSITTLSNTARRFPNQHESEEDEDQVRPQACGAGPPPTGSSTRPSSASSGLRSTPGSVRRRAGPISDYLLDASPGYVEMLDRQHVEGLVRSHSDGLERGASAPTARHPHAGGLALDVPSAGGQQLASGRTPRSLHRWHLALRGHHPCA